MKIEGNQKELDAMAEFHKGNRTEGLRLRGLSLLDCITGIYQKMRNS